ncbi:hypothetical protein Cgig2_031449 [Carnegiea gigantea]|uniref:Protein EARLY FLOWERING 4 domain-containing protein n=1 Tax=Carnegiea gigantea TaxID=171969 RepID=A0A9Q1K6Y6_9CARY|nr:hypothetical protein Cgig2_031449 [Carnegiea gigantea]
MEESTNDLRKTLAKDSHSLALNRTANRRSYSRDRRREMVQVAGDEEGDAEAWETLSAGIERVQSVLDQNRALIQQVNENHQSKIPENLVKNVALIREINGNINKVVSIYSDLSVNFTDLVRQRKAVSKNSNGNGGGKGGSDVMDAAVFRIIAAGWPCIGAVPAGDTKNGSLDENSELSRTITPELWYPGYAACSTV